MDTILSELPNTPIGWIGLLLAATAAGFTAYLVYNRQRDGADDRLIVILKQTVEELERKVNKQDTDIQALSTKVSELKTTNETLTRILQGRDEATLNFQREVLTAVGIAKDTNEIAKNLEKSLGRLTDVISAHIVAMKTSGGKEGDGTGKRV